MSHFKENNSKIENNKDLKHLTGKSFKLLGLEFNDWLLSREIMTIDLLTDFETFLLDVYNLEKDSDYFYWFAAGDNASNGRSFFFAKSQHYLKRILKEVGWSDKYNSKNLRGMESRLDATCYCKVSRLK